jgi:hypothetical protein
MSCPPGYVQISSTQCLSIIVIIIPCLIIAGLLITLLVCCLAPVCPWYNCCRGRKGKRHRHHRQDPGPQAVVMAVQPVQQQQSATSITITADSSAPGYAAPVYGQPQYYAPPVAYEQQPQVYGQQPQGVGVGYYAGLQPPAPAAANGYPTCVKCSSSYAPSLEFCPGCGTPASVAPTTSAAPLERW